jgi:hypothetical protein
MSATSREWGASYVTHYAETLTSEEFTDSLTREIEQHRRDAILAIS